MLWLVSRELDDGLYNGRWGRVKRRVEGAGLFLSLSLSLSTKWQYLRPAWRRRQWSCSRFTMHYALIAGWVHSAADRRHAGDYYLLLHDAR
jgi:hypothetical protein